MFKATKLTLTAAMVIAVAGAPAAALAAGGVDPSQRGVSNERTQASTVPAAGASHCHRRAGRCVSAAIVQVGTATVGICHRQAGRCIAPTSVPNGTATVGICHRQAGRCTLPASGQTKAAAAHPSFPSAAASPEGLQWGDAGIGAAGMLLLLLIAGAAATTAARRQHYRAPTA